MLKYGVKIKNIEASTLYGYNLGIRQMYESKDAMFPNSLLLDFLLKNKLKVWKEESTRDIICLNFNFGCRSFEEEVKHIEKTIKKTIEDTKLTDEKREEKLNKLNEIMKFTLDNKGKYKKISKEELRTKLYTDGISIKYTSTNKSGKVVKEETIYYKMLFRSTGKAKKGSCMFINEKLYKKTKKFLLMNKPNLLKKNPMIVEASAYMPLVASSIDTSIKTYIDEETGEQVGGRIKIDPKNILVLKDIDSEFMTNVISIETDENKHCKAVKRSNYKLKNTLFDGQGLIDSSIFPKDGNGYVLLRHHFCKMACFCSHIQKFYKDYFGDKYETATVKDMWGNEHYVKDIKLITTDNAMKWIKLGVTYEDWCNAVNDNGNVFGIVKTAHASKLGQVQKMSYQMVNSLDINTMDNVVKESIEYVNMLKNDKDTFIDYLEKNKNFSNDYEVLIELCKWNKDFHRSSYFRDRQRKIIENHVLNLKTGKIIQNAENLVIVGSPYSMLLYGATNDKTIIEKDDTFSKEDGTIQCYTERFDDNDYLAFFRSPFNSRNNLTYLHNVYSDELNTYFKLGKQVIAVNMINTDFQDRNNGSDQDSDSGYTTNQIDIVNHARNCYLNYPTIVNNIPKEKNSYEDKMEDYARMDNNLASSSLAIGLSSNLAQISQTYMYNSDDDKYKDYTCILSVLAQIAIDNAKRRFDIDLNNEIDMIKKELDVKNKKYPEFWQIINRDFNKKNINTNLKCPMNVLYNIEFKRAKNKEKEIPLKEFFVKHKLDVNKRTARKVEDFIEKYCIDLKAYQSLSENTLDMQDTYELLINNFDELVNDISKLNISTTYISLFSWLIDRGFCITDKMVRTKNTLISFTGKNKSLLMSTLYNVNSKNLLNCFVRNNENSTF